jgi:recombination protein RecA
MARLTAKPETKSASAKALESFQAKMDKTFGAGKFKRSDEVSPYEVISTGSIVLDYQLQVGGWVEGRLHELWGPEGAGKTTMALIACAQAQKKHPDKQVGYIDVEQRLDRGWAVTHGVDLARMYHVQPSDAEEVADMLKEMCRSGLFSFVVVDSVGAMLPEKAKEKDAGESVMGKEAQVITRMVKLNAVEAQASGTTVLLLNQVRANFGYGADTTTPGGFALKHGTTSKLAIKRGEAFKVKIDGEDRVVGHYITINIQRNSVAPAYRVASFPIFYIPTAKYGPIGIDRADEAATIGLRTNIIQQGGAWYTNTITGEKSNGRDALVESLRQNPAVCDQVRDRALSTVSITHAEEDASKPWEVEEEKEEKAEEATT